MNPETIDRILMKLDWQVKKQERFLGQVSYIRTLPPEDAQRILKNALWVDGTLSGQVQYALRKREMLLRTYRNFYKRYKSPNGF